jgi:hypothetical protein
MDLLGRILRGGSTSSWSPTCALLHASARVWGLDTMSVSQGHAPQHRAVSTMFACPKCKERNCSYTELQTRSADEGTTIFLFCHTCSTQWTQGGELIPRMHWQMRLSRDVEVRQALSRLSQRLSQWRPVLPEMYP